METSPKLELGPLMPEESTKELHRNLSLNIAK